MNSRWNFQILESIIFEIQKIPCNIVIGLFPKEYLKIKFYFHMCTLEFHSIYYIYEPNKSHEHKQNFRYK